MRPLSTKLPDLQQRLGHGWLGPIYAAGNDPEGVPLAVRVLGPERLADVGRITQSLSFAAQHEHPHLLAVSAPQSQDGEAFYFMPYAVGGSLRGVFDRYRAAGATVEMGTMLDVARQVAEALDFAHTRGVLHGNLKPENVLLQPLPAPHADEYRLLVSDFGLNSLRTPDPHSPYLPAPQRAGAATTLESDLYAIGALIFEGMTGRPLSPQPLVADLVDVPEPAARIVARCLGLQAPFADMSAFLGYLRALQLASHSAGRPSLRLTADQALVSVIPGEVQEVRVKVQSPGAMRVRLGVEGLPPGWLPELPELDLQPGVEALVTLKFSLPRKPTVLARTYEAQLVALTELDGGAGTPERMELARLPLQVRVEPFEASALRLQPLTVMVRRAATFNVRLRNDGNQTQRYSLEVTLPAGSQVQRGSARRQLELAPGGEFNELLEVRLPTAGLSTRVLPFAALANSVPRPTLAEGAEEGEVGVWPPVYNVVQDHVSVQQQPLVPWWALTLVTAGLVGGGVWVARPPQIEQFVLDGATPAQGAPFTLAWKTAGARQVKIAELPDQNLETSGQLRVLGLKEARTYTLVASGLLTQKRQQITVAPLHPGPRITTFKVTPQKAVVGQSVRVEWNVQDTQQVQLTPFGAVPARGSREYQLNRDTRFQLTARKGSQPSKEDVSSVITATLSAPLIDLFTITPPQALRGENVTVRWEVTGANKVRLAPLGELPHSGTRTFQATETANYTLKASNGQQETTANASLTVRVPQATIQALTITPPNPVSGQPVKVQWRSQNAERAELRWGNQRQTVAPSGDITLVASPQLQSVTLVALNANGDPAMLTKRLQVSAATSPQSPASLSPAPPTPAGTSGTPPSPPAGPSASAQNPALTGSAAQSTNVGNTQGGTGTAQKPATPSTTGSPAKPASSRPPTPQKGQPTSPVTASGPAPVTVQTFSFTPASTLAGRAVLYWNVTGVSKVRITGLSGPNADGTFPPAGSLRLPATKEARTYILTAGNGSARATLRVPASKGTAPNVTTASRPKSTTSADVRYQGVAGTWNHSFGQVNLQVSGNRVTGSLLSSRADLPSGDLSGRLSGDENAPTLNAFIGSGADRVALVLRFDLEAGTFDGLYASRSSRVPWCGWKAPAANPCP